MKILVLGHTGQVGGELMRCLAGRATGCGRPEIDLLRPDSLVEAVRRYRPKVVINAAADTAVDRAETDYDSALVANAQSPAKLADACSEAGARLIHFSTDYVFSGDKGTPYIEEDETRPVNAYGRTKLLGEQAVLNADPRHLVFRLSWVYSTTGRNFALTMLRLAREGKPIRVVDEQVGSPTYARCISEGIRQVVDHLQQNPAEPGGLFHFSAGGETSWAGFAQKLLDRVLGEESPRVEPIPSSAFPTPARRPSYSVLSNQKVGRRFGVRLPNWEEQVAQWAKDLKAKG